MKRLRIAYFGTPDFSAKLLKMLIADKELPIEIVLVVTQPPKKAGRKQIVTKSPVEQVADEYKISVNYSITVVETIDLAILFAYGEMISEEALSLPQYGFWNLHPSLLPKYRGPSPVAAPLIHGDVDTGITVMKMDNKMDHGPILAQEKTYIFPVWRRDQLTTHLVEVGFKVIKELLLKYGEDLSKVPVKEQDHSKATYTKLLQKDDGYIELSKFKDQISKNSKELFNLFRGLYPWPGIWTRLRLKTSTMHGKTIEKRLKITKMHWENNKIVIKKIQLEGKNETDFEVFKKAYPGIF